VATISSLLADHVSLRVRSVDRRDRTAEIGEASVSAGIPPDALDRLALSRREAAAGRSRASLDRGAAGPVNVSKLNWIATPRSPTGGISQGAGTVAA
jgi:hypothetical protein